VSAVARFAAWTVQRVEVYTLVPGPDGHPLLLAGPESAPGPRIPGVVLAHGENPRDAALRALIPHTARTAGAALTPGSLRLLQVLSDLRPQPGHPGLHVLRLAFELAGGGSHPALPGIPLDPDPGLLREPAPAWVTDAVPGSPPRVQRPAAYAVVVRDGEALLTRVTGHGVWTLPGGGIDHGEHPDDAVRRETLEETGLDLVSARLFDVDSRHVTGRSPAQITEDFHGVRILYRGTVDDQRPPQVREIGGSTDAAAWVPLDRLHQLRLTDVARTTLQPVQ
jgi:ADP-ribose pyrophosphatase YjhB (NUDIX family)